MCPRKCAAKKLLTRMDSKNSTNKRIFINKSKIAPNEDNLGGDRSRMRECDNWDVGHVWQRQISLHIARIVLEAGHKSLRTTWKKHG